MGHQAQNTCIADVSLPPRGLPIRGLPYGPSRMSGPSGSKIRVLSIWAPEHRFCSIFVHVCMCACVHMRMYICILYVPVQLYNLCTGTPTHLKMHAAFPCKYNFRIRTVVVVKNSAVIERQSHVRLVVLENIIPRGQVRTQVFRQEQCRAPHQYFIFFEITSCKSPETSYLESRRKF